MIDFKTLPKDPSYLAPDGSEIRLLSSLPAGGLCHCTLPVNAVSTAVKHQTVEEIWYCISGSGVIWQKQSEDLPGEKRYFTTSDSFTIPRDCSFQFKNIGDQPLCILICTMPQWPGPAEAVFVKGFWTDSL